MRPTQRPDLPLRTLFLLLALPALAACSESAAETSAVPPSERLVQVRTLALEPRAMVDRASLPADLLPRQRATLAAEVGGAVESVSGELGQAVAAGRVLATIDERVYAQQVAESEALLRQAVQQYERARNLFERRAVTKVILLDAETGRDVAEARLASSRLQLDKARVRAPWPGRIAARRVEVGDFVAPGTPLFELVDSSRLKVRAPARAADVPFLAIGREVEVRVDAYPGEVFRARVERIGAELDPASRTLDVEAEIENRDGRLKPGLPARLEVPRRELAAALVVPTSAVLDLGDAKAVYVVVDGRAARRTVVLGPVIGEEVVVEGLERGARVVIEGQHAIADGQAVEEV
ncbi:MAG: efflux RND transporter periplasmic adaptor subunit [Thermoanaerobaculia bacterium]|nr:MAG: efflux RND transporter periplasmic adaptor subunit [Thermoanaerobaculia bacterium]